MTRQESCLGHFDTWQKETQKTKELQFNMVEGKRGTGLGSLSREAKEARVGEPAIEKTALRGCWIFFIMRSEYYNESQTLFSADRRAPTGRD